METGIRILTSEDINTVQTAKGETLGAVGATADGRKFVYASFGGTSTIPAGTLVVSPAVSANSTGLAIASTNTTVQLSAGSKSLIVTNGSTAVTQDQFADGFVEVLWSGGSFAVRINGNTAAGNAGAITLSLQDPLSNTTALVPGTDTVNLTVSPFNLVNSSTTVSNPAGVTVVSVPNTSSVSNFGWVQVGGHSIVAGSGTKGEPVTQSTGTAGNVVVVSAATNATVGIAKETGTTTTPVELKLA